MKAYTITDIGKVRAENQDCVRFVQSTLPRYYVLALCDGMGGAKAGSVASAAALGSFTDKISELITEKKKSPDLAELTKAAAEYANTVVFEQAATDDSFYGMGTTLVAAVIKGTQCCIANIGDSRAYLISGGGISQITADHSFVEDMVKSGAITREQAKNHPRKNVITRALGVDKSVECDIFTPAFNKNDILLLCSDGLSNTLADDEILKITQSGKKLAFIGKELLDLALSRGAPDNVTVGLLQR